MVGGDEADRNCLLAIVSRNCPSSVILSGIDVTESLRDVVVENLRIVLLHYALECGLRLVIGPVSRGVSADASVSHSQSEVCIREEGFLRLELHLPSHVIPVEKSNLLIQTLFSRVNIFCVPISEFIGKSHCRVGKHGC